MSNDQEIKKFFDHYNEKLKSYKKNLDKDFPDPYELTSYINSLEQYCTDKLGTKTRQETYIAVIRANKKKSSKGNGSNAKSDSLYENMIELTHGYIAQGDSAKKACIRAGFRSYETFKLYKRKFNKK